MPPRRIDMHSQGSPRLGWGMFSGVGPRPYAHMANPSLPQPLLSSLPLNDWRYRLGRPRSHRLSALALLTQGMGSLKKLAQGWGRFGGSWGWGFLIPSQFLTRGSPVC